MSKYRKWNLAFAFPALQVHTSLYHKIASYILQNAAVTPLMATRKNIFHSFSGFVDRVATYWAIFEYFFGERSCNFNQCTYFDSFFFTRVHFICHYIIVPVENCSIKMALSLLNQDYRVHSVFSLGIFANFIGIVILRCTEVIF